MIHQAERTALMNKTKPAVFLHTSVFQAMNTVVETACYGSAELTELADMEAKSWFEYAEQRFSRFRPDSELSRLNRQGGQLSLISESMLEVLQLAEVYRKLTDGILSPLMGRPLQELGYTHSFTEVAKRTVPLEIQPHRLDFPGNLLLDPAMKSVRLPAEAQLDLGGLVKSWTVRRLADWLQTSRGIERGMINAGGDLIVWGEAGDSRPVWSIWIQNPLQPAENVGYVELNHGSAATSGKGGRSWRTDRGVKHHLIDPRTMNSAQSNVLQCTVIGPDPVQCEVWSKVICIMGREEGMPLFGKQAPGYEAVLFDPAGRMDGSPKLIGRIRR